MSADDHLRFSRYIDALRNKMDTEGYPIRYMLVLSSTFSGRPGDNHPFHARAAALKSEKNVSLTYLTADILAQTATQIEIEELSPQNREDLNWDAVFSKGLVNQSDIETELGL